MIVFVALVGHGGPIETERIQWIADHGDDLVPFPGAIAGTAAWTSPSGRVHLRAWDNAPPLVDGTLASDSRHAVVASGYVLDRGTLADPAALLPRLRRRPLSVAGDLGGVYSLCIGSDDEVVAWAGRGRLESLFHGSDGRVTAVSNRPLAAHLAVRTSAGPAIDRSFAREMVASGMAVGRESTPFVDVRHVPEGSTLHCTRSGVRLRRLPGADRPHGLAARRRSRRRGSEPTKRQAEEVAAALTSAFGVLRSIDHPIVLSLTGGKDSRLLAALLHHEGIPFTTSTTGLADSPDVVVAREVADALGVEHRRVAPRTSDAGDVEVDVRGHVLALLRACDGMQSAFERNVHRLPGPSGDSIRIGGGGGEVLRGGLATDPQVELDEVHRRVRWQFLRFEHLLGGDAIRGRDDEADGWLEAFRTPRPAETLAWFHRDIRLGRWNMAGRLGHSHYAFHLNPFFDSQVIERSWRVDLDARTNERLFHEVLRVVNPGLASLPFADSSWRFEAGQRRSPAARGAFSTRNQLSGELGEALFGLIDDAGGPRAFDDILDVPAVDRLRGEVAAGTHDQRPGPAMFLWTLASMALLQAGEWQRPPFEPLVATVRRPTP